MNNVVSGPHAFCVWYLRFYGTVGFRTFRGGPGFLNKIVDFGGPIFMQLLEYPIPPLPAAHLIVGGYF